MDKNDIRLAQSVMKIMLDYFIRRPPNILGY